MPLSSQERQALAAIAQAGPRGCGETSLTERGFSAELIADLIRADFATRSGSGTNTRLQITDAGRRALADWLR